MAPRATPTATRGRGRPKRDAAPVAVAVTETPKRRGRAPKAVAPAEAEPQPKKRGRAAKAPMEEAPGEEAPVEQMRGGRGRPRKEAAVNHGRRARKQEPLAREAPPSPAKRRGRPSKNAIDLDRVAGSPRVSKRASPRAKTATRKAPAAAAHTPRIDPRLRSRLRTRIPPTEKKAAVVEPLKPKKRVGRPPKKDVAAAPAKKTAERKTKDARITKPAAKPRKRRGFTVLEVPDKYAKKMTHHLQGLIERDAAVAAKASPVSPDAEPEASIAEEDDAVAGEGNSVNIDESSGELEVSERPLEEIDFDIDGHVDSGAQEPSVNGEEGPMKFIDDEQEHSPTDVVIEEVTEEIVIVPDDEMEVEIEEPSGEPQAAEVAAAEELQIQQEITEEVSVKEQLVDDPDSLFDGVATPVNVSVAQMLPATYG